MKLLKGNKSYRKINFICLGVGKSYPHFLSMKLRELYNSGDENLPALFLIEYPSEKAFFNKFEGIKKYFYYTKIMKIIPSVTICPWDDTSVDWVHEG